MLALLLAVAAVCSVARTDAGKIARSRETIRQFMREVPCPGGVDKGSRKRCRSYVVDHVVPLCAGGHDGADNYQWQRAGPAKEKDKAEVALCRWIDRACGRQWKPWKARRAP